MKKRISFLIALILMFVWTVPSSFAATASPAAGKVATQSTSLNVRKSASTSAAVVSQLEKGSWITLLEKSGNWWRVRYSETGYGYCSADYITPRAGSTLAVLSANSATVNIYRGEGFNYEVKKMLPVGSSVAVLTKGTGWSCIMFNGTRKGYVPTEFLKETANAAIRLSVVRYSQTDSRWKNVRIGTNGGTIGTIGCTTTCLAMTETYATGQTVTPATMASRLTYSSGGSLYWPSNYTTLLADSDALSRVYHLLASGKPVIFGAKKANGTQHWVVVTGNDGGGKTASHFTINDPGSSARKTLADFFAIYPNYYKLAWR